MKKNDDFIKYVKRWLISHYSEFNYKPYLVRDLKNRGCYILKFQSVANVEIYVKTDGTFDMWFKIEYKNKKYLDNPLDLTAIVKKNKKGYFCDLCTNRIYFKNKANIWGKHLKELIPWINNNLKAENQLVLNLYKCACEIKILAKDLKNLKGNSKIFSLIK